MRSRCSEAPPPGLLVGVEEFNRGDFFRCHETLEALWLAERDPIRFLYQGILQIAVGFYHLSRHNYTGADNLLRRGMGRLKPFAPRCQGVNVQRLLDDAARCHRVLTGLGPEGVKSFDLSMLPTIEVKGDD